MIVQNVFQITMMTVIWCRLSNNKFHDDTYREVWLKCWTDTVHNLGLTDTSASTSHMFMVSS